MTDDQAEEIGIALAEAFESTMSWLITIPPLCWLDQFLSGPVGPS